MLDIGVVAHTKFVKAAQVTLSVLVFVRLESYSLISQLEKVVIERPYFIHSSRCCILQVTQLDYTSHLL